MKVVRWFSEGIYPLDVLERGGGLSLPFTDDDGRASDRVLVTGISGAGKSTLLEMIGRLGRALWQALTEGKIDKQPPKSCALVLQGLMERPLLVVSAKDEAFWDKVVHARQAELAVGWVAGAPRGFDTPDIEALARRVREAPDSVPNMLLLTEDEQRNLPDAAHLAEAFWALHARAPQRSAALMEQTALLLSGKKITLSDTEMRVRLARGGEHPLGKLSSGERRIIALLLAVAERLHPGGVLLIDEPEAHLHPSQTLGFLTTLEQIVLPDDGQMILTSHTPEVWRRYDSLGVNLVLEDQA